MASTVSSESSIPVIKKRRTDDVDIITEDISTDAKVKTLLVLTVHIDSSHSLHIGDVDDVPQILKDYISIPCDSCCNGEDKLHPAVGPTIPKDPIIRDEFDKWMETSYAYDQHHMAVDIPTNFVFHTIDLDYE